MKINIRFQAFAAVVLTLTTSLASGQIANDSFEAWDTIYTNTYSSNLTNQFAVPNAVGGVVNRWNFSFPYGISRTTDSHSGNYSLIVHTWYTSVSGMIEYYDSISSRPLYFQGYYKYTVGNVQGISQGSAEVSLTRFNGTSTDTIATGVSQFDSTASFTPFQITFNYVSAFTPDSIRIRFTSGTNYCITADPVCNLLYLDDLLLTNTPMGISSLGLADFVSIYPNPTNNTITIQTTSSQEIQFEFYNSMGELLLDKPLSNEKSTVDLSAYANGIYFYKVSKDLQAIKRGSIIKQ